MWSLIKSEDKSGYGIKLLQGHIQFAGCDPVPSLEFSELGYKLHFRFDCKASVKKALSKAALILEVLTRRVFFEEIFKKLFAKGCLEAEFEFWCMHF